MADWTCPHGIGLGAKRGDCHSCNAELARRRVPSAMTGDERYAEVIEMLNEPNSFRVHDIHGRLEALVGRSVWTHEFAQDLALAEEARTLDHPADLGAHVVGSLQALMPDKPIYLVDGNKGRGDR